MRFDGIVLLFLLCQLFPNEVCSRGSQRLCMNLEVEDAEETFPETSRRQGVPGKLGPKGDVGPQGIRGEEGLPGRVDYEIINSTMDEKINSGLEKMRLELREELIENQENIQSLQEQLTGISLIGRCDFVYKGTCYWVEIHDSQDTNYEEAESICNERRSVLSYPVDETHYELIMKEMRSKMPSGNTAVYAWAGLRINPSTGDVTLPTGASAPHVKWYPGFPRSGSTLTNVLMYARKDPDSSNQGLHDYSPSSRAYGVICQYKLFGEN